MPPMSLDLGEGEGVYNGNLGTTSESFPQYNKLRSVRHVCELHCVVTS